MTHESKVGQARNGSFGSRNPLLAFFILTYLISWGFWFSMVALSLDLKDPVGSIINGLASYGPTLAGLILTAILFGSDGLLQLSARLSPSKMRVRSYLTVILLPFLIMIVALMISLFMDGSFPTKLAGGAWILPLVLEALRIFFFGGALGEEIGWRGFALPRLLSNNSPFKASLILGLIWGIWHAPIYFVSGSGQNDMLKSGGSFVMLFPAFVVWTIGLAVLFTWVYKKTNGNLLMAILFHTAVNTAVFFPSVIGAQSGIIPLLNAGLTWVAAIIASRTKEFRESNDSD
jgi:membrane protease YdiL (CAAX protease family)